MGVGDVQFAFACFHHQGRNHPCMSVRDMNLLSPVPLRLHIAGSRIANGELANHREPSYILLHRRCLFQRRLQAFRSML